MGYKRYGSSTNVPNFDEEEYEAVTAQLQDRQTSKHIYFGIKKPKTDPDAKKSWRELTSTDFSTQIESDTGGCSATITKNNNDTTNKTGIITYRLSANTTGSSRVITFNYKGTRLFTITQDAGITDNNIYVYFRKWKVLILSDKYVVCTRNDITSLTNYDFTTTNLIENTFINTNTSTDIVLYHVTNNKDISNIFLNKTIKTLISNNTLTYVSGKKFTDDENELIKAPIKMIKNNQLQLEDVTDNSKMYVYSGEEDATKGGQIDFSFLNNELYNTIDWSNVVGSDGDITAVGKYRYNQNGTTVTPTIK